MLEIESEIEVNNKDKNLRANIGGKQIEAQI